MLTSIHFLLTVRLQKSVEDEMAARPLTFIAADKLFRIGSELRAEIKGMRRKTRSMAQRARPEGLEARGALGTEKDSLASASLRDNTRSQSANPKSAP